MKRSFIILVFAAFIMMGSCKPIEDLPDEPAVEFGPLLFLTPSIYSATLPKPAS
ncbi:MAG: hypothetical protein MZV63_18570 [Marinilabiliales bacterium]|nr:hypothetical protein [Marinilabiliales bacterium]